MRTIRNWDDLRDYGINFLTGEACAVGKRLLCDVSEQGRRLLCSVFGLPSNTAFAENWNRQVNGEPAVGSIFLPTELLAFVSAMILLESGCKLAVVLTTGEVLGIEPDDDVADKCIMPVEEEIDDGEKPGEKKRVTVNKEVNDPLGSIRRFHAIREIYGTMDVPHRGLSAIHTMSGRSQGE